MRAGAKACRLEISRSLDSQKCKNAFLDFFLSRLKTKRKYGSTVAWHFNRDDLDNQKVTACWILLGQVQSVKSSLG